MVTDPKTHTQANNSRYNPSTWFAFSYIALSLFLLFIFCWITILHGTIGVSLDFTQKGFIVLSVNHPDAELLPNDSIKKVEDLSYSQLLHAFLKSPFKTSATYEITILRDKELITLTVSNKQLSIIDFISSSFWFLLVIGILTGLSIATLSRAPPSPPANIFVFTMISFAMAVIADMTLSIGIIQPGCVSWNFALTLLSSWIAFSSWTHFVLRFPQQRDFLSGRPFIIAAIYLIPPVVSCILAWFLSDSGDTFWPQLGRLRNWAIPIIIPGTFIKHCYDIFKSKKPLVKNQLLPPMAAAAFGITPYLFLHVLPGLIIDRPLISSNLVALMAMGIPLMFFISLIRYRLFEVDRLINKIISYICVIIIFSLLYSFFIWALKRWFFGRAILSEELFMLFIIGIILIFQPLMNWLENKINIYFFRHKNVPTKLFHTFSEHLTTSLKQDDLINAIVNDLPRQINILSAGIILIKEGQHNIFPENITLNTYSWSGSTIFDLFKETDTSYLKTPVSVGNEEMNRELKLINDQEFVMVFPLKSTVSQPGMLLIGPRKDGRFFSKEEIHLLSGFANQTALALENAIRYEILIQSKKQLEDLFNQKVQKEKMALVGEISATLAHELQNPLGIIHSSAQYIKNGKQSETVKNEMLDYIIDEVDYLSESISNLLGFARQRPPILEKIDLNHFLNTGVNRWCLSQKHRQNIAIDIKTRSAAAYFYGDRHQLTQVLHNLIENAEDMMPDGGKILISTILDKDRINILILDTGPGVKEENVQKVFNSFFTTKEKGLGLGLMVCRQIIEAHNGSITLKNNPDSGLTVTIHLPIKPLATGAMIDL